MPKPLNSLQLQAAELVARGASENEIASICGKSRSWVQALKRRTDFQSAVNESVSKAGEVIREQTKEIIISDLERFQAQFRDAANLLYDTATAYLEKIKERVDTLNAEEISTNRLGQSLKNGGDSLMLALEVGKASLGIDQLLEDIDDLKKIGSKRLEPTNGHQSSGNGSEKH